jgi:hypothetical protein
VLQPIALHSLALGRDHGVSRLERACAQLSLVHGSEPMPTDGEEIPHGAVHHQEALGLWARLDAAHGALALARGLVGDLGEIVGVAACVMGHRRHDRPVRGAVAPEAIGDESARDAATPLQQPTEEPRGGMAIPTRLQQDVDDLAVLVDGPPEVPA